MKPTEEQIKEFWEWCGFRFIGYAGFYDNIPMYRKPNGIVNPGDTELPDLDLDNLFEYAMPAIYEHNLWLELQKTGITNSFWCVDINPAIELFWAIWKVIHAS